MSADVFLQAVTQGLFILVFGVVLLDAVRQPRPATIDTALFFGVISLIVAEQWIVAALHVELPPVVGAVIGSLLLALPYLLLRLLDDFSFVPWPILRGAEAGLVPLVVSLFVIQVDRPLWLTLLVVLYFVGLMVYTAVAFLRRGRRSPGVTRRRMYAVAVGSLCLGLTILVAGLRAATPGLADVWMIASRIFGLASAIGYAFGFAPPPLLRRAWQEPELRAFLGQSAHLPRLPDLAATVRAIEQGAGAALGAPHAVVALWDNDSGLLVAPSVETVPGQLATGAPDRLIGGQAFAAQRPIFSENAERDDPEHAAIYRSYQARAVLAAPITAGEKKLGVLIAYAPRAPIFARDDLTLLQLLADQAAVILESRTLIEEAARMRARDEANRLKDDFLSAAAHDLKTPLTTLLAQAQLLERRVQLDPEAPPDVRGIQRLVGAGRRLTELVHELLDASRVEQGELVGSREVVDLGELAREVCRQEWSNRHRCLAEVAEPVVGEYDRLRIRQLIENLIDNAVKYSPAGGDVRVRVWAENGEAHLTVSDEGIGIPRADLTAIFDRFQRGTNVDDRRFTGLGLGLYICRGIAEAHAGRLWALSQPGRGSTFHVVLPLAVGARVS